MISNQIKSALALSGRKQTELAEHFEMTKQSMNNKIARDSWSAKDLAKVAEFVGGKLVLIMPDGQRINITHNADD